MQTHRKILYDWLVKDLQECPDSAGPQQFLPLSSLDSRVTKESVKAELPFKLRVIDLNRLPERVIQHAKKTFAILTFIGQPSTIKDLLLEGLTDADLPLSRPRDYNDSSVLISENGRVEFRSFSVWKQETHKLTNDFLDKQWLFLAPVLDTSGQDMTLNPKCPLPFVEMDPKGTGISSSVWKSAVHPAHQQGIKAFDGAHWVAVKDIRQADIFDLEKKNLEILQTIQSPHLIRHFATITKGKRYYIIFPWAEGGSLSKFWKDKGSSHRTKELAMWCLRQMLGLTDALKMLHADGLNVRHGDLKPDNILHFPEDGWGRLVAADVGVSKHHGHQNTGMRLTPTDSKATTRTYEAPEADFVNVNARSRRYDIWSLGCVFLEFIVWFLHGSDAVDAFKFARDHPNFSFYRLVNGEPVVHPKVSEAIRILRNDVRCEGQTALQGLLALISEHLIKPDVNDRDTAAELHGKLQKIVLHAEIDPSYIFHHTDPAPPVPLIFQRKPTSGFVPSEPSIPESIPSGPR